MAALKDRLACLERGLNESSEMHARWESILAEHANHNTEQVASREHHQGWQDKAEHLGKLFGDSIQMHETLHVRMECAEKRIKGLADEDVRGQDAHADQTADMSSWNGPV